jgi:hypothetical protein
LCVKLDSLKIKDVNILSSEISVCFLHCIVVVSASEHSVVLKEVKVPLWHNSACGRALRQQFGSSYSLPDTSICAGAEGRDACDVCMLQFIKDFVNYK